MGLLQQASLVVTPNAYKASKLYSVIPTNGTGDLDVVRATSATRVNSAGLIESVGNNIPRLDYTNATCPSILVEPQRTNLALWSDMFANTYWTKGNFSTISANTAISPSGIQDADKHIAPNPTGQAYALVNTSASITISTSYTFSVFVKISEVRYIQLRNNFNGSCFCNFDLQTGTIGTPSANTTANIINYGNGWYRCSITVTASTTTSSGAFGVNMCNALTDGLAPAYTGSPDNGYFVWGAQLEVGSNATSYIPTTTTSVTRNVDEMSKIGISSLIGQTEGVLYWEGNLTANGMTVASLRTSSGILNGIVIDITATNLIQAYILENNSQKNVISSLSAIALNSFIKIAYVYKSGNCSLFINGVKQNTTSQTFTFNNTISRAGLDYVGYNFGASQGKTKYVKNCTVFPTILTDAQCISLTTL